MGVARVYSNLTTRGIVAEYQGGALYIACFRHAGQHAVYELCGVLTAGLREVHPAEAICRAVTAAGEKLAPVLPRADDHVNELPDALVTLDD